MRESEPQSNLRREVPPFLRDAVEWTRMAVTLRYTADACRRRAADRDTAAREQAETCEKNAAEARDRAARAEISLVNAENYYRDTEIQKPHSFFALKWFLILFASAGLCLSAAGWWLLSRHMGWQYPTGINLAALALIDLVLSGIVTGVVTLVRYLIGRNRHPLDLPVGGRIVGAPVDLPAGSSLDMLDMAAHQVELCRKACEDADRARMEAETDLAFAQKEMDVLNREADACDESARRVEDAALRLCADYHLPTELSDLLMAEYLLRTGEADTVSEALRLSGEKNRSDEPIPPFRKLFDGSVQTDGHTPFSGTVATVRHDVGDMLRKTTEQLMRARTPDGLVLPADFFSRTESHRYAAYALRRTHSHF